MFLEAKAFLFFPEIVWIPSISDLQERTEQDGALKMESAVLEVPNTTERVKHLVRCVVSNPVMSQRSNFPSTGLKREEGDFFSCVSHFIY